LKIKANIVSILVILLISPILIHTQETTEITETESPDNSDAENIESETESTDRREEILLYGIDSEVLSVLGDLQREKVDTYNDQLVSVFAETRNTQILQGIFRLWDDTSYSEGLASAKDELEKVIEDEDFDSATIQTAMSYLANQNDVAALPQLIILADYRDSRIAAAAVRAIGEIGSVEDTGALETLLEKLKKEDPIAEEDLVAALIVTLGDLRYEPAAQELVYIVEDAGASAGHRRLGCISVGKIGRTEDFEIIETLYYETDDATLRSYALAGLAEFPNHDTTDILIQALKRDSFWRIRVTAAEKLIDSEKEGVSELLQYKALYDPVNHVRIASLKSLGSFTDSESQEFLLEYYKDKKKATDVRLACLSVIVENQTPGTTDAIFAVMDELWEKDEGRFLEFTCLDLSRSEWNDLAPVYDRMLGHSSWLIQVYGIRGIRRNNLESLQDDIKALDIEGVDGRVRREVTAGR
jgi:HEAT repeat protein